MNYLHVASMAENSPRGFSLSPIVARQTGNCLYSLIEGLRQENFGLHTIELVAEKIRQYRASFLQPVGGNIFTDSGGYSIIKGDVHPQDVRRFIKCYNAYVEHDLSLYEYVFSLDIPFSKRYPHMNKKDLIYSFNKESLNDAKRMLEIHPELKDKFYFVWHFKMASQYEIWKRLYNEVDLREVIRNRAIGGMVGMRQVTSKSFSPFTAMAYKCLYDYMSAEEFTAPFRLHYLGMYIQYDRFHIALLEQLFQDYLGALAKVEMSYDSINYSHTVRMNKDQPALDFVKGELHVYEKMTAISESYLKKVYGDERTIEFIDQELARRKHGVNLHDINSLIPINIHSNICLDRLFEHIVKEHCLVDIIKTASSPTTINRRMQSVLKSLANSYPRIFTRKMVQSIMENIILTYEFHHWFVGERSSEKLESMMTAFIKMIGFPECIR
jgi:hypothetical protein